MFGAAEFDFWKRGENVREARKFNRELFMTICVPLADRSTFIKPGDEVVPGIARWMPQDIRRAVAFHIESEGKRLMVTADTFTQYVMAVQRPEWHFEMDDDKDKAVVPASASSTWRRPTDCRCRFPHAVPGHRLCGEARRRLPLGAA